MKNTMIIFFLFAHFGFSQTVFRHDVFNGGVCVAGFSTGLGVGTGVIELFVPPGSTVKKTLLMVYTCGLNTEGEVRINGHNFIFNSSNIVTSNELLNPFYSPVNFHVLDITDWFINSFTLNPTLETTVHPEMPFRGVFAPILYVEYENADLPALTSTIIINDQPIFGSSNYVINNLNPISTLYPVGFSLYTDRHSYNQTERTHVHFNNNYLGLVYGSDAVNQLWTGGVKGHFYRENNTLFGLDDDIPDNTMNETDALADVSPFINNHSTSVNFSLQQIVYPVVPISAINLYLAYFLTYTSPCQPFEASLLTSDTTTCPNNPLQLGVTVPNTINATYEWLPQTNLSCYDCPNPVFMGSTTTNYTVRIWASDSCSKVLPVRVRVLPDPSFESIEITESVCGGATGQILVTSTPLSVQNLFQLNGGTPQNNGNFTNLAAGAYTVTVTNAVGCSKDSVVVVGEFNNVQAAFSVNPTTGTAPLDISITNQSQNATAYFWNFLDESGNTLSQSNGHFDSAQCPVAGTYNITLIAGNGTPHCNDTASVVILVKEPFEVFAYTFVTDDTENYQIFLSGVSEYRYSLYSLDGKLVYQKSGAVENAGYVDLWEIGSMASSMYLFRVWVKSESGIEEEIKGKLVVLR